MACWLVVMAAVAPLAAQGPEASGIEAPLLDETHAQRAYRLVEDWLAADSAQPAQAEPIRVTGLVGVRLVLRSQGIVVGQGVAYRQDVASTLDQPGPAVDLTALLAEATEQAKVGVRESLADARLRAILEGRALPEAKELTVSDVHMRLVVDLELGYGLETISVPVESAPDAVYARFAPCYHGLGFRGASLGRWGWVWPGEAMARNIAPSSQLVLGLKQLGIDRSEVARLARPEGVVLARFQTIHLVRPAVEDEPARIIRSGTDQARYTVSEQDIARMSDRLVEHLYNRFTTTNELSGTYHPTSGRYDPPIADDDQAALACYAVMHYSRYLSHARPFDNSTEYFVHRGMAASSQIGRRALALGDQADPRVVALVLLTGLEAPEAEQDVTLREGLGALLVRLTDPDIKDKDKSGLNDGARALSAAALATLYERTRQPDAGRVVRALLEVVWSEPDGAPNLSALPWLVMVQERAGGLLTDANVTKEIMDERARRSQVLSEVIDRLCQQQVIEQPTLGPDDVLGGFMLTPGPSGSPPNPDWRNAQALMLLSLVLRDSGVTSDRDKLGWLIAAGYSARFVGQLMMDDASCYYVRDRVAARGGERLAPWDNRLPLASSAMSLLALTELQTTLASMRPAEPAAQEPEPASAPDPADPQVESIEAPVEP